MKLRKGQVWCALLSLSLGLSAAGVGVSASARFYLVLGGVFAISYLASSWLNGWIARGLLGEAMETEKAGILLLSQFALVLYVLHLVSPEAAPLFLRTLLHLFCGLLILSMVAKHQVAASLRSDGRWALVWGLLNDADLMHAALFLSAAVVGLGGLFTGAAQPLAGWPLLPAFLVYAGLLVLLLAGYAAWAKKRVSRAAGGRGPALFELNISIVVGGAPWVLAPLGIGLAGELHQIWLIISPLAARLLIVGLLATVSILLYRLHRQGRLPVDARLVMAAVYYPATVATFATWRTHRWTLELGTLDYFATGVQALPAQQWWDFGRWPLLDLVPRSGLADFGVQWLYGLFHGVHDLDPLIWLSWLPAVVGFLAIYAFLALVTSPLLALLVTLLLPIQTVVVGQYAGVLVAVVVLALALQRASLRRFLLLWMILALFCLWRPALGWPSLVAAAVVVAAAAFEDRRLLASGLGAALLVLGLVPAALLLAEVLGSGDSWLALREFLALGSRPPGHPFGALEVSAGMQTLGFLLAQLLPVLAVICLLYLFLRRFVQRREPTLTGWSILFIVVFSLLVPPRLDTRPGAALLDPSLLLLVLVVLPFLVEQEVFRSRQLGRSTWVLSVVVLCSLLGSVTDLQLLAAAKAPQPYQAALDEAPRVRFRAGPHRRLVDFLRSELADAETFVDFTGSPVLYALASKPLPLRSIADFRAISERTQAALVQQLEELREAGEAPWLVFRSPPGLHPESGNRPTEALSYRVVEHLYEHYLPFARIDGWEIWRQRGRRFSVPGPPAEPLGPRSVAQHFELGGLAREWADGERARSVARAEVRSFLLEEPLSMRPRQPLLLTWELPPETAPATYLHVRARALAGLPGAGPTQKPPSLTVRYGDGPQSSFSFRLSPWRPAPVEDEWRIRLRLNGEPRTRQVQRVSGFPDRLVFRATGRDPGLQKLVDLSATPSAERGVEQWVTLSYRTNQPGTGQIFFASQGGRFSEESSFELPLKRTGMQGAPKQVSVPILGLTEGSRLTQLRIDPPAEGMFEIVGLDLTRLPAESDDYVVRLTTQFQWATGTHRQLSLESSAPVLLDGVYLRSGD